MARENRLIYANDLTDRLNHATMVAYPNLFPGLLAAVEFVEDSPTVDAVEVVHGRWINWGKSETPTYENYGTCSVCHEDAEICTEHRNYCPNCGAKMDA